VEAVIKDVKKRYKINERNVFTLSWSSSGAAAYAISMQNETAVRGSYIMGSVFRRHWLPPLEKAKGHVYLIDHSPEDKVCPFSHAKDAQVSLEDVGAIVRLSTYKGGHGWHGDTYGRIRSGISWLIEQADRREYPVKQSALDRTTMK